MVTNTFRAAALFISLAAFTGHAVAQTMVQSGGVIDAEPFSARSERNNPGYCQENGCDTVPRVLFAPAPRYPRSELALGREGEVSLRFEITVAGRAGNIQVLSATAPSFAKAAVEAVENWKFQPAMKDGKPVGITARQSFDMRPER
jgi:TonB family protein